MKVLGFFLKKNKPTRYYLVGLSN